MIFKIMGCIWGGIGVIAIISSCSTWLKSGELGNQALNYAVSEVFVMRIIFYFLIFIFPGLILVYLGRKKKKAIITPSEKQIKKCPKCAEEIKAEAVVCRFCGYEFPQPPPEESISKKRSWKGKYH